MKITPRKLKWMLNFYPPYLGAGIRVQSISEDWRSLRVCMKLRWFNRNFVGSHFGGSLFSMTDPHFMLLLIPILGKDYTVWDQQASIDFIKPGKGKVMADFLISQQDLEQIKRQTAKGDKYLHHFYLTVTDESGDEVARVQKVVYIRKKKPPIKSNDK